MHSLRGSLAVLVMLAVALTAPAQDRKAPAESFVPGGLTYVWWKFDKPELEDFQIDVTIHNDVDTHPGLYFQLYQGRIGSVGFYFGLQTDVYKPDVGGQGKGLIFSRWKTRELSETRPVSDGWAQSAGYEGDFVGIRKKYAWTGHRYRCRLTIVDEDEKGLWYGFFVLDQDTKREDYAGALRFPREGKKRPLIQDGGGTWMEVYSGAEKPADLPRWHVSIDGCYANHRKARACGAVSYYSRVPNTDIYFTRESGSIHMLIGKDVVRKHARGKLF